MKFTDDQVRIIFKALRREYDIFEQEELFECVNWTKIKSDEDFISHLIVCTKDHLLDQDQEEFVYYVRQIIKDNVYSCFHSNGMTLEINTDDWEENEGVFVSITRTGKDKANDSLFISSYNMKNFIEYLKNMIDMMENVVD